MDKILITDASDEQIRTFGETILGLDTDALVQARTRAQLLAVIGPAWTQDHISVPPAAPSGQNGQSATVKPVADTVLLPHLTEEFGPITQFKIISTNMPGGNSPAHPCVNGRQLVMQRNMLIEAPYAFYLDLRNANVGEPYEIENGNGKPPTIAYSDVTNYPLSDVVLPSPEEIAEWHARRGPIPLAA